MLTFDAGIGSVYQSATTHPVQGSAGAATGVPLIDTLVGLGSSAGLSASSLFVYASAATGAYALWEQLRFRMARSVAIASCRGPRRVHRITAGACPRLPTAQPGNSPQSLLLLFADGARTASWCQAPRG